MNEEDRQQFASMQNRILEEQKNRIQAQQAAMMFNNEDDSKTNIMETILNSDKILARIEQHLRQLKPQSTSKGYILVEPDKEERLLNEEGIHAIISQLSWYINPDVILSNYTDEEVNQIVLTFGIEFSDWLHINMERFGMDKREKQRDYNMLCTNVINIVDATYHRSIGGKALESMNKSVMVTQSEPLNQPFKPISNNKFNLLKPKTWV
jgi:hypothetical protein